MDDETLIRRGMLCKHIWTSNRGQGGTAHFVQSRFHPLPVMHVQCKVCLDEGLMTKRVWDSLARPGDSRQVARARFRKSGAAEERKGEFATEKPSTDV